MSQLYIPKRLRVGYQKREETYTGKLSYIIYYDDTGKLRKETSWESWRDKKIAAEEFDNVPTEGFVFHRDVKRYNWSRFSSRRTLIRVWDPRGMEFEITTENLIGILTCSDVSKRGLVGSFVYAWAGPELVLLPTSSEEYQKAASYTSLQSQKVSAKTLIPGHAYRTKKELDVVYLGRFPYHEWVHQKIEEQRKHYCPQQRLGSRCHIFTPINSKGNDDYGYQKWIVKTDAGFLATQLTEEPVEDFAARIEAFQKELRSAAVVKWEVVPAVVSTEIAGKEQDYNVQLKQSDYYKLEGNILSRWSVERDVHSDYDRAANKTTYTLRGYTIRHNEQMDITTQTTIVEPRQSGYSSSYWNSPAKILYTEAQLQLQGFGHLYVTLDNGRRVKIDHKTHYYFTSI